MTAVNLATGRIRPRDREAVIQSLRAGVVPRIGQQHIQVGRADEVAALLGDINRIADGGSAVRLVIGEYGAGKSFFLNLVRSIALERKLVTVHADLSPHRRLYATGGQARGLYAELMRNLSTRAKPEGGAMPSVVERFIAAGLDEARSRRVEPETVIRERLAELRNWWRIRLRRSDRRLLAKLIGTPAGEQLRSDVVRWGSAPKDSRARTPDRGKRRGAHQVIDTSFYDI